MQPIPTIICEDDSLLVINKPYGMVVNKSDTTGGVYTLQDWVEEYLKVPQVASKKSTTGTTSSTSITSSEPIAFDTRGTLDTRDTFRERAGIVHRLDKETSGILLIAKTQEAFLNLQQQFKERVVKKTYIALAHGKVDPPEGEISAPVGRLPWNRMRFGVVAGGRESLTRYKLLSVFSSQLSENGLLVVSSSEKNGETDRQGNRRPKTENRKQIPEYYSLLELYPQTGRTHQIRVHLKHINHPIFADFLYAGRKTSRDDRRILERVFLHAAGITFKHPSTGEQVGFESALPEELQKTLDSLK